MHAGLNEMRGENSNLDAKIINRDILSYSRPTRKVVLGGLYIVFLLNPLWLGYFSYVIVVLARKTLQFYMLKKENRQHVG